MTRNGLVSILLRRIYYGAAFAWDYLLHIVTRSQSSHRLPPVMTMGMEKVTFAKHK
jgi:hypothetical protein